MTRRAANDSTGGAPYDRAVDAPAAESLLDLAEARPVPGFAGSRARQHYWSAQALDVLLRHAADRSSTRAHGRGGPLSQSPQLSMCSGIFDQGTERFSSLSSADPAVRTSIADEAAPTRLAGVWQGADDGAAALRVQALELGSPDGDATVAALALTGLARSRSRSDIAEARALSGEALEVAKDSADPLGRSGAIHVLGVAAQMSVTCSRRASSMTRGCALARELRSCVGIASEAGSLSVVERRARRRRAGRRAGPRSARDRPPARRQ